MVVRGFDILGRYVQFKITISELFDKVKLETAYYAKNFPEQFEQIVITDDESDRFLHELRHVALDVSNYLKSKSLDRQGVIYDESKRYVIGADKPNEVVDAESETEITFSIRDNYKSSDSLLSEINRGIERWMLKVLVDKLLNPTIYKGELKPEPINTVLDSQIFYLTLK